ncbi:hypothetical protein DICVIV_01620 [Dictyocaulus viviparus]|uniref:Uncharacterized protein n=1 Tax=Dictyocaulus viviparus TaxID=29172 RepID=A0A0D8Y5Y8_DICVI|nr:hypothetical protein DICVIV_01620 [Dictyocaulus viviparus]
MYFEEVAASLNDESALLCENAALWIVGRVSFARISSLQNSSALLRVFFVGLTTAESRLVPAFFIVVCITLSTINEGLEYIDSSKCSGIVMGRYSVGYFK